MEIDQLTDEQIANLTPEQIEMLENNPDKLAGILEGQAAQDDTKEDDTEDKPKPAVKKSVANDAGDTTDGDDDKEPVVLNKSGKGVIPYEKHKELRVEVSSLRDQLQTAKAEGIKATEQLQALLKDKDSAKGRTDVAEADEALTKHLDYIKENMPELHTVLTTILAKTQSTKGEISKDTEELKKTLDELKKEREEAQRANQQSIEEQVAEAKENNPDLTHWEANDPEAWDEALKQDEILRNSRKWAGKPYAERFEEVVRRVRAINPEASAPKKTPDPKQSKTDATAKVEKATAKKPTTLSDFQGGANPASEREQFENLAPHELAERLMKMSPQKAAAMRAELD
jgi:chromosome segregation ATPase